ncbi:MAG: RNA polymerase sigma factor [Deltaproteobacteria bacterium]|nr:RNA polymerase sigma factor [Deltaproteobacteria bacterium]
MTPEFRDWAISLIRTKYYSSLKNFLVRYASRENIEDIIQDTCLKVAINLPRLRSRKAFKSWVFMIAKREALQKIRKEKRFIIFDPRNLQTAFEPKFESLPCLEGHEELKLLIQGYSICEISRMRKISPASVKSRIFRSRKVFKSLNC